MPALSERNRLIVLGSGIFAFALVHVGLAGVLRPSSFADGAAFTYAPHARLLLLPFGAMPFAAAVAIFSALNLFCLYRAAELMLPRGDLALLAVASPAALTMVASGYAGGFLALLATVVLMQGHKRPGLAGLNLALMTVQPQFALLFALVLLPLGYWRAVALALPWTLALMAASVITFGPEPWGHYLHGAMAAHAQGSVHHWDGVISLHAAARIMGLPTWAALMAQWGLGFVALAGAIVMMLRRGCEPRGITLALLAIMLTLPDARSHLLAVAAPALTLALFADSAEQRPLLPLIPALLIWCMPIVAALFGAPAAAAALAAITLHALARQSAWTPRLIGRAFDARR